jgi:hypothetical protein
MAGLLLLVGLWSPALLAQAQADQAAVELDKKLIALGKEDSQVLKNLTHLSDVIGHRLTGSASLKRANDWAAEVMKSYGLTNVHLEPWELPVAWERGFVSARVIEPDNGRAITAAAMAWTPGTNGKIVGDVMVINANTPEELKKYEGKLKNAIVLRGPPARVTPISEMSFDMFGPERRPGAAGGPGGGEAPRTPALPARAEEAKKTEANKTDDTKKDVALPPDKTPGRPGGGFNARGGNFMQFRREMSEFMRKEGVAVLLQDSGKPHGLLNMTGSWGGRDRGNNDPLPTLFVTHDHYAMLHRLATRPEPAKTRMEIEVTNKLIPGPHIVYNTVGEIKGSEKPDEFVVLGAHIDSWDLGQGTTDNGTGTCVVLEAARILAKSPVKPKRTIRFVLFSGEEQGLHGSRAYVNQHKDDLAKTTAAVVHDTGTGKVVGLSLMGREALKATMEGELATLKELGVTDISTRSMSGSDHQSFEGQSVPGFMFRQDPAEYRLTHHSQSDTLDKAREPDLIQGAQVMSVIAMRLANREAMLPRDRTAARTATPTPPAGEAKKSEEKKP